jgi:hypothetical protein
MIIKEIKNLTLEEFEELRNIYLSTFPLKNAKQLTGMSIIFMICSGMIIDIIYMLPSKVDL